MDQRSNSQDDEGRPATEASLVSQTLGAALGVTASLPVAQDPALGQYMQALITPSATAAVERFLVVPLLSKVRTRNISAVVAVAADALNQDPESLVEHIGANQSAARAFVQAARAAEFTDSAEKLKVLGDAFASLMSDSAALDDEMWFIRQVAPLETYHLRVLGCWVLSEDQWKAIRLENGEFGNRQVLMWSEEELVERSRMQAAGSLADELVRLGFLERGDPTTALVINTGFDYDDRPQASMRLGHEWRVAWCLSALGTRLLERIGGSSLFVGGGLLRD